MYSGCVDTYFSLENFFGNGLILTFEARHASFSVDIAANASNFEEGVCFVTNGEENELVQEMLDCLEQASSGVCELMKIKFADVFQTLETNKNVKTINKVFEVYCQQLVVFGFNSASYNLNVIKQTPIQQLLDKTELVIESRKLPMYQNTKIEVF